MYTAELDRGESYRSVTVKSSNKTGSSNIGIKFDGVPKLNRQSNYQIWSGAWKIAFNAADWWDALSIETPTKDDTTLTKAEIKKARKQMQSLVIGAVAEDIQTTVVSAENAYDAWKALKNILRSCVTKHNDHSSQPCCRYEDARQP